MCDQTEVSYLENDVVWVKIGPIWWPGVVKDLDKDEEGKEILAGLKRKPIAVVKFFQEDNYEFVKNLDHIYHYSCRRKDEFIKKGLDKFRAGAPHMKKFPVDVTTAEGLVQGDVNIINDPKFYPEKKQNYSEIFGSGKKKSKKESESHPKPKVQKTGSNLPYRPITHQRFINKVLHGESDHKVRTLIQPVTSPEDSMSRGLYKCHMCKFETPRVNVIVAHHRLSHSPKNSINWTGSDTKAVRRKPAYKPRKSKAKKLFETSKVDSSDDESLDKKKYRSSSDKPKSVSKIKGTCSTSDTSLSPVKRKITDDVTDDSQKKPRFTDVLLADWSEEDEEEKSGHKNDEELDKDNKEGNSSESSPSSCEGSRKVHEKEMEVKKGEKDGTRNKKMSCFDFDEEEEGFIGMSNANTYGRKIPRVIPVKDKSELDVDMEIGELFKNKNESESDKSEGGDNCGEGKSRENDFESNDKDDNLHEDEENFEDKNKEFDTDVQEEKDEKAEKKGKRKWSKDQESKSDEDSLALRRGRRSGSKKSYLNEGIEKLDQNESAVPSEKLLDVEKEPEPEVVSPKTGKEEETSTPFISHSSSSSRRKQDLKLQTVENSREETVYTEILSNEQKSKNDDSEKKSKCKKEVKTDTTDDISKRIDNLLAETSVPDFPDIPSSIESKGEKFNKTVPAPSSLNFSFDYVPPTEMSKSTNTTESKAYENKTKESSPSYVSANQNNHEASGATTSKTDQGSTLSEEKLETNDIDKMQSSKINSDETRDESEDHTAESFQFSDIGIPKNEGILAVVSKKSEVKNAETKDNSENMSESPDPVRTKGVKTIKLKSDSLPSTILSPSGKLKGQTIIHQKGGTYVILSQPPQVPRQKSTVGKAPSSGKLVILTNQLGEQKIITTSGLQQSKFKIDSQKLMVASTNASSEGAASTSGVISVGKSQPVIKMVPDGKGGVMKQLTVSPKKVLVGGTKVLVSGAGASFSPQGNTIQKIAFTGGSNLSGDYRLIENYKGSGKTVLIQGGSNASTGVLLKSNAGIQRPTAGESTQSSPNFLNIKKKPKILMRAKPSQSEYVVHSEIAAVDSPTYVMKRKGADGKISTQKIIRRPVISSPKTKATTAKTFILSSDQHMQKAESLIIKTNHDNASNKIIRLTQKVKEPEGKQSKFAPKIIQKPQEAFSVSQNTVFAAGEAEEQETGNETAEMVAQSQTQQAVLPTQVMAMPGPIGTDGNQTYVLVSVDEHGVVQPVENSLITYDTTGQTDSVFVNSNPNNTVILINPQTNEEAKPVFSNGSQDILAEALANTNVLEGNMNNDIEPVIPSILLPPAIPSSVVQETSITLQKPIMTPLEMPTSVTPDTSGLEPPPLPPTPTEEDVLMEDQETELQASDSLSDDKLKSFEKTKEEEISKKVEENETHMVLNELNEPNERGKSESDSSLHSEKRKEENESVAADYYGDAKTCMQRLDQDIPREEFIIENSQEEQGSSSFQSMPLLNDEPDTSDDAQGSEPIGDQDFDLQKTRAENEELSSLLRDQEPPSSTNNEFVPEFDKSSVGKVDGYRPTFHEITTEDTERNHENEKPREDPKSKEISENRDMSMPIITDEGNVNSYSIGQIYMDTVSQKRIQEETEVTSTTDEYANKDANIV